MKKKEAILRSIRSKTHNLLCKDQNKIYVNVRPKYEMSLFQ